MSAPRGADRKNRLVVSVGHKVLVLYVCIFSVPSRPSPLPRGAAPRRSRCVVVGLVFVRKKVLQRWVIMLWCESAAFKAGGRRDPTAFCDLHCSVLVFVAGGVGQFLSEAPCKPRSNKPVEMGQQKGLHQSTRKGEG
jgi:hypothetical protein